MLSHQVLQNGGARKLDNGRQGMDNARCLPLKQAEVTITDGRDLSGWANFTKFFIFLMLSCKYTLVSISRAALAIIYTVARTHLLQASPNVLRARFWQLPEEGRRLVQAARQSRGRMSTKTWGLSKTQLGAVSGSQPLPSVRARMRV